jgi:hypothetical protein
MRARWINRAITITALSAATMLVAVPAQAEPPHVQEQYHDVFDELLPAPDDEEPTFCGLVDVPLHGDVRGYFSIKNQGNSEYFFFADRFRGTFTYTNPETGLTFTIEQVGQFRDLHLVDNGDGTLTITGFFVGTQRVIGDDGELLLVDHGLSKDTFVVDHNGTIDPEDDEFVELISHVIAGPHDTEGRDFCEDFLLFTSE